MERPLRSRRNRPENRRDWPTARTTSPGARWRGIDLLGERWTLLAVRELLFAHPRPLRFGELIEALPGISRSLLAARLRELEAAGIVERHTDGAARAIGGWALTERGASLADVVRAIGSWSIDNLPDPTRADRRSVRRRLSSLG